MNGAYRQETRVFNARIPHYAGLAQASDAAPISARVAALFRRGARGDERIIVEHRREPPLRLGDAPALARGIILDLVALDLADAEIVTFGMTEIEPAHRC